MSDLESNLSHRWRRGQVMTLSRSEQLQHGRHAAERLAVEAEFSCLSLVLGSTILLPSQCLR